MFVIATVLSYVAGLQDRKDDKGATAVEYGLLVALIAAAIIAAVTLFGTTLAGLFGEVTTALG